MSLQWRSIDSVSNFSGPNTTASRECPVCESKRFRRILSFDNFQFYTDSAELPKVVPLSDSLCLDCYTVHKNPSYTEVGLQVVLGEAGYSYGASAGRDEKDIKSFQAKGLLRAGASVLDAGCYDGRFLARFPETMRRIGVDVDGPAIERGKTNFPDIDFIHGDFETFQSSIKPDVIIMLHVLEHLPRPVLALKNLRANSHPNTILVAEVPLLELGLTNDVNGYFSVHHLTHFSKQSFVNCLHAAGWEVKEVEEKPDYNGFVAFAVPGPVIPPVRDELAPTLVYSYLSYWYDSLKKIETRLQRMKGAHRCALWGAGIHTEFLYQLTSVFHSDCQYTLVDMDQLKRGKTWRGLPIQDPQLLATEKWLDSDAFIASSYQHHDAIIRSAREFGVPERSIAPLYDYVRVR
jgi:SAM-dependent methyltransferase